MSTSTGDQNIPDSVAIVALGPSKSEYFQDCVDKCSRRQVSSEVWAINCAIDIIKCDRGFLMDNPRYFLDAAKTNPSLAGYGDWLWRKDNPIIYTSEDCPEYPCTQLYPYEQVVKALGHSYFNSTPAYAMAMAIVMGVREIKCYGMDYHYEKGSNDGQKGRACIEYWIGHALAKGIKVYIAGTSSLCDQNIGRIPYGYSVPPKA